MPDYKKNITDKIKSPQWRLAITFFLMIIFLFLWSQLFKVGVPAPYNISYSQFEEILNRADVERIIKENKK